ncbi:MAG: hypothetical protein E6Q97_38450 [Desulfurellales bacterium]|nr:MAG: hypothetical protein E6Q97_38450 [Desulfurellales bacterium]
MATVQVPLITPRPINAHRLARNAMPVDPALISKASELHNIALAHRGKELFRATGTMSIKSSPATETKWRFACRTSPYVTSVKVVMLLLTPHASATNGNATVTLTDGGAFTGSKTVTAPGVGIDAGAMSSAIEVVKTITGVPSDTVIYGSFSTTDTILLGACVYEDAPAYDTANGYVQPVYQNGQPILAADRQNLVTLSNALVRRGGAQIFNWSSTNDATPQTNNAATFKNLIDGTTTTGGSGAPGWRVDMRYRCTRGQSTTRCKLYYYGANTSGSGVLRLFNEDLSVQYANLVFGATLGWSSATVDLPREHLKLIAQHYASAGTTSSYALSLFTEAA